MVVSLSGASPAALSPSDGRSPELIRSRIDGSTRTIADGFAGQESGQVLRIQMVWMLVRHQHRIKISQGMPGVGDVPWIDENPGAVGLG